MQMHRRMLLTLLALGWFAAVSSVARAADTDWPQWRGPLRTGSSPDADPPTRWSETQNVKWKVKLPGSGTSTPIVWGRQVFIQTAVPVGRVAQVTPVLQQRAPAPAPAEKFQFVLLCLDRATG